MQSITPSLAFFYNPPGILVNYHITCEEVPISFELVYQLTNDTDDNNQTYNYDQPKSHVFYHSQIDTKKIYQVTCELASSQFLNKRFYNIDYNQQSVQQQHQQQQQEISPLHLKFHLKQYLTNYLATKEIYKQNLHGNMMQDNFNDEIVNGSPSFRGDYTQEYENSPASFNLNNDNIQQGV